MQKNTKQWNKFLNGELPFVVLNGVLYQTNTGTSVKSWLPNGKDAKVVKWMPVERIGTVPKEHKAALPNTGFELKCIGPY